MDKKMIIGLAVVAVVVASAACVTFVVMTSDDDGNKYAEMRLVVYGNANNDNYLNDKDVDLIKSIAKDGNWDKETNPFADANNDGKVDSSDVDAVNGFLEGKTSIMYYRDWNNKVSYVHYPVTGKIGVSYDVCLDAAILGGWYGQVKYMNINQSEISEIDESYYPGVHSFISTGKNGHDFDEVYSHEDLALCCGDNYNFSDEFISKMLGAHNNGGTKDVLLLPFARCVNGMDMSTTIITVSVMTMHQADCKKYIEYLEGIDKSVHSKLDKMGNNLSEVIFYRVNGNDNFTLRVPNSTGFHHSNVYMIKSLGFKSAAGESKNGGVNCGIDEIIHYDPDVIFVINTGWVYADLTDEQFKSKVKEMFGYLEQTRAYKQGNVFYIGYELIGSAPAYAVLPLLASFVWPDQFDEDDGWKELQDFYSKYLNRNIDVKNSHIAPLKMSDLGLA